MRRPIVAKTLTELLAEPDPPRKSSKYCRFNRENLTIEIYDKGTWAYEIDLERCTDSAELLDWILQLHGKGWVTPQMLFDIIEELEYACHEVHGNFLQGAFCPGGEGKEVSWKEYKVKVWGLGNSSQ